MVRRTLMIVVLTTATAILATGQTASRQTAQIKTDEEEIISLSQQLAEGSVISDSAVVKETSSSRPERITLATDGEADPLKMDNVRVRIKGNRATLTSRLVFSGRRSGGEAYERFESWTVTLVKQKNSWRVVQARLGDIR